MVDGSLTHKKSSEKHSGIFEYLEIKAGNFLHFFSISIRVHRKRLATLPNLYIFPLLIRTSDSFLFNLPKL